MKDFRKKPVVIQAKQYTQEMQDAFVSLGKNEKENPISVTLDFIPDAVLEWNFWLQKRIIPTIQKRRKYNSFLNETPKYNSGYFAKRS